MKLDFAIVGVQKSGTTALSRYLAQHSMVCLPLTKETHFFWRPIRDGTPAERSEVHLARHYERCTSSALKGDATPVYSYWPHSLELLREHNPELKCILLLRDPVLRAFSHWKMEVRRGRENLSFSEAIRGGRRRVSRSPSGVHKIFSYVERGFYSPQINRLQSIFPESSVFIGRMDQISEESELLRDITDFLGLPQIKYRKVAEHLAPGAVGTLPEDLTDLDYLHKLYRDDLIKTSKLIPFSIQDWIEERSWR